MPEAGPLNAVVVATNLNPSIFSQLWLIKHNIFQANDFENNDKCVFTPIAVNVITEECNFTAVPERVQLDFSANVSTHKSLLMRTLGTIVKELPHTPYTAVGFNFNWRLWPANHGEFAKINRTLFLAKDNPLAKIFSQDDCRFGSYLSKNVQLGRLRLEIKPIFLPTPKEPDRTEALQLTFNFNLDLRSENRPQEIIDFLGFWDSAHDTAVDIVTALGQGWSK